MRHRIGPKDVNSFRNKHFEERARIILNLLDKQGPCSKIKAMYSIETNSSHIEDFLEEMLQYHLIKYVPRTELSPRQIHMLKLNGHSRGAIDITSIGKEVLEKYNRLSDLIDWNKGVLPKQEEEQEEWDI